MSGQRKCPTRLADRSSSALEAYRVLSAYHLDGVRRTAIEWRRRAGHHEPGTRAGMSSFRTSLSGAPRLLLHAASLHPVRAVRAQPRSWQQLLACMACPRAPYGRTLAGSPGYACQRVETSFLQPRMGRSSIAAGVHGRTGARHTASGWTHVTAAPRHRRTRLTSIPGVQHVQRAVRRQARPPSCRVTGLPSRAAATCYRVWAGPGAAGSERGQRGAGSVRWVEGGIQLRVRSA